MICFSKCYTYIQTVLAHQSGFVEWSNQSHGQPTCCPVCRLLFSKTGLNVSNHAMVIRGNVKIEMARKMQRNKIENWGFHNNLEKIFLSSITQFVRKPILKNLKLGGLCSTRQHVCLVCRLIFLIVADMTGNWTVWVRTITQGTLHSVLFYKGLALYTWIRPQYLYRTM